MFAIFNQAERQVFGCDEAITAEIQDYNQARDAFANVSQGLADVNLKEIDRKIIEIIGKSERLLSAREITEQMNGRITQRRLYPHLHNLKAKGFIEEIEGKDEFRGFLVEQYKLTEEYLGNIPIDLPNGIDLMEIQ